MSYRQDHQRYADILEQGRRWLAAGPPSAAVRSAAAPLNAIPTERTTRGERERQRLARARNPRQHLLHAVSEAHRLHHQAHAEAPPACDAAAADDRYLVLAKSAIDRHPPGLLEQWWRCCDWLGIGRYEDHDPRWIKALLAMLATSPVTFPDHLHPPVSTTRPLSPTCIIAIAGGWGTGNAASQAIGAAMRARAPDVTIHLGEVHHAGALDGEPKDLLASWPAGAQGSYTLNSNHEMYGGGHGYFAGALQSALFAHQNKLSYFALVHPRLRLIGIDSAYGGQDCDRYHSGNLPAASLQAQWLAGQVADARASGQLVVLCSHHHGCDLDGTPSMPFYEDILAITNGGPDIWYWGHLHAGAAHRPIPLAGRTLHARCLGHGGIPYSPIAPPRALDWLECSTTTDPDGSVRGMNGFLLLEITMAGISETFIDESGAVRATFTVPFAGAAVRQPAGLGAPPPGPACAPLSGATPVPTASSPA